MKLKMSALLLIAMMMSTTSAYAVEDAEFWGAVREKWGQVALCNKPIGISDGMCDINYFFWDPEVPDDVPDALVHFRN